LILFLRELREGLIHHFWRDPAAGVEDPEAIFLGHSGSDPGWAEDYGVALLLDLKRGAGDEVEGIADGFWEHKSPGFVDKYSGNHGCHFGIKNGIAVEIIFGLQN
jgi:hypothetical protein